MPIFHAIILGLVQGLTEFLPVSSSGHLIVFPELLGWDVSSVTFDVTIHLATLLAILVALRTDLVEIARGVLKRDKPMTNLSLKVLAATVPAVIIGGLFSDQLEAFRSMWVVGVCLIVWGVILYLAERYSETLKNHVQHSAQMSWGSAMLVGCMQVLAFIPGTSRSGVTMSAGLLSGFSKETAAKFSFLLAIPAIAGAGAVTLMHVLKAGLDVPVPSLIAGFTTAFVAGIFSIRFLLLLIKKWSFAPFAIYRVVFGVILLVIAFSS